MPAQWFYRDNGGQERGPVEAEELKRLAAAGTIAGETEVRREDLDQWVAAETVRGLIPEGGAGSAPAAPVPMADGGGAENPYEAPKEQVRPLRPRSRQSGGDGDVSLIAPLANVAGWLKFIGISNIVFGVLYALTIIGILFAWLPIWIGILANSSSNLLREGYNAGDSRKVNEALRKMATIIIIGGVLMILSIAGMVLYIIMIIGMIATGAFAGAGAF